jgi:hypothetical protein
MRPSYALRRMYACMFVCMYVGMYAWMYVCMYVLVQFGAKPPTT